MHLTSQPIRAWVAVARRHVGVSDHTMYSTSADIKRWTHRAVYVLSSRRFPTIPGIALHLTRVPIPRFISRIERNGRELYFYSSSVIEISSFHHPRYSCLDREPQERLVMEAG
jgi:hypothetical protein